MASLPQTFSQEQLVSLARTNLAYLREDWADFQAFNPKKFTDEFLSGYAALIDEVRDTLDDETVRDEGTQHTARTNQLMSNSRRMYQFVKYFAEEAFGDDPSLLNQIGVNDYRKVRRSVGRMVLFLSKMYRVAQENWSRLEAAGMPVARLEELQQLRDELESSVQSQQLHTSKRGQLAQVRREKLDALSTYVEATCKLGKLMYRDVNPAKYRRYLQPRANRAGAAPKDQRLPASTKTEIFRAEGEEEMVFTLTNTGSASLSVYAAASSEQAVPSDALVVLPGNSITFRDEEVGREGEASALMLWNGQEVEGTYRLEVMG